MPQTLQQSAGRVVVSTWLSPEDAQLLRSRAAAADRSLAAEVRRALRPYLNNEGAPAGHDEGSEKTVGQDRYAPAY